MAILKVLGMDPSLRNWGIAAGTLDTETGKLTVKHVKVIQSVIPEGKQVRQNSKDLSAAQQIMAGILPYLNEKPHLIFAEVPVGSQSARAMASYGLCVGILGSIRALGIPFFEVTPNEVKMATVGTKTATKDQMIAYATREQPDANWPMRGGVLSAAKAEHMADAYAAIVAGLNTNEYLQLAAMQQTKG
ncbi:hypothetical protein HWB52_gp05 [Pseudomonas phage Littlefix]|uniref:Holliday junction nuclease RuvC n=1 Tax=Pseudomonas phage Littlefix TaxID=2079289 RepID=A0A2K9VHL6_9CAUD|nr:hypothetical protein HWB52_gp05 [Pseudomonas phage Littlefix]AUV61820.1 hypothetical protein PsPhLittlefix_gp05 [Pseudomonas phage Littlefix]